MLKAFVIRLLLVLALFLPASAQAQSTSSPRITNVRALTPTVAAYDRLEIQFELRTQAEYPNLPYDPEPPAGLEQVSGVSADAILTAPDGKRIIQPAFYYQPYTNKEVNGEDHRIPNGRAYWLVRFTPQQEGVWQARIRAVDAGGMSLSAPVEITVRGRSLNEHRTHGFLRVSPNDPRYFEFSDGSAFHAAGFNGGFSSAAGAGTQMAGLADNRINFIRTWMSGAGINGSQWTPWSSFHLSFDAYLPPTSLVTAGTYPGHDAAYVINQENPCLFQGWLSGPVAVQPGATYDIWARVKLEGVGSSGFVIKTGGWLEKRCNEPGQGVPVTQPVSGSTDWIEVTGTLHAAPGQMFLDFFYMTLQGGSGRVLVDEVRVTRSGDPQQTNILSDGRADAHLIFDQAAAFQWDGIIVAAE